MVQVGSSDRSVRMAGLVRGNCIAHYKVSRINGTQHFPSYQVAKAKRDHWVKHGGLAAAWDGSRLSATSDDKNHPTHRIVSNIRLRILGSARRSAHLRPSTSGHCTGRNVQLLTRG